MTGAKPTGRSFRMELDLAATPDQVWKALTEPQEVMRWFAPEVRVRPGVGGEVVWAWGPDIRWPQEIELWQPGRRLKTRYASAVDAPAGGKLPLFMDFEIEGRAGSTRLRLVHSGFGPQGDFDKEYDGISRGWQVELRSLRHYLERHLGEDRHVAWATRALELPLDEIWTRLLGPDGLSCAGELASLAEGDPFRIEVPGIQPLRGRTLLAQQREFSGIVESHGDAWLRITSEDCGGNMAWIWLASYGGDEARRAAREHQAAFEALLERAFAGVASR